MVLMWRVWQNKIEEMIYISNKENIDCLIIAIGAVSLFFIIGILIYY